MVNETLKKIYESRLVYDAQDQPRNAFPASLPLEDGNVLYHAVRQTQSTKTLEIGMAYGTSTLFILQAIAENGGGTHVAIDPYQQAWWEGIGILNVRRAGFSNDFRCMEAPSFHALPALIEQQEQYDFILIDGNHRFEYTLVDFFLADRLLKQGGHLMLHDVWLPSMRKMISFILRNRQREYAVSPVFNGPPLSGLAYWKRFFTTWHAAPFDFKASALYAKRDYNRHFIITKTTAIDYEKMDADWQYYHTF